MPLILGANSVSGYTVKNSLRFNDDSSDYLSRTPATATNRRTWTWSGWIKRANLGTTMTLFGTVNPGTSQTTLNIDAEKLTISSSGSGFANISIATNALLRDVSAWYHVMFVIDTTQATSTNRVKIYINGVEASFSTATYPAQNSDGSINQALNTEIGRYNTVGFFQYFDGYMSEVNFIDGQALTPSSFGQTDVTTGIWVPKAYIGTYGTNGFYLKFANSAALGTDSSGNGNTWTVNNLTSVDQSTDTPTNNFATWNSLRSTASLVSFTEGNLKATALTDANTFFHTAYSSIGVTKGKWYAEFKCIAGGNPGNDILIAGGSYEYSQDSGNQNGVITGMTTYNGLGQFSVDTVSTTGLTTYIAGDIIGVYLNVDDSQISFYKNGVQVSTTRTLTKTASNEITYFIAIVRNLSAVFSSWEANFGSPPFSIASGNSDANGFGNFEYAVPSGYYALCTKNLADYG